MSQYVMNVKTMTIRVASVAKKRVGRGELNLMPLDQLMNGSMTCVQSRRYHPDAAVRGGRAMACVMLLLVENFLLEP